MKEALCFDIGGTMIKGAIFDQNGQIQDFFEFPTQAQLGGQAIVDSVIEKIKGLQGNHSFSGIGISTAGQVDPSTGSITYASDAIPKYKGIQVKAQIEAAVGLPTVVENDVNCALLGELDLKQPPVADQFTFMMTIGTGIGGALTQGGNIYHGPANSAGEIGYLPMGAKTLQEYGSVSAIIAKTQELFPDKQIDGKVVFNLAVEDLRVKMIVDTFFDSIARGLASVIYLLSPVKIIIGGGISVREGFVKSIEKGLTNYVPHHILKAIKIVKAENENRAGVIGAYRLLQNQLAK